MCWIELVWVGLCWFGLVWAALCYTELSWSGLSCAEMIWIELRGAGLAEMGCSKEDLAALRQLSPALVGLENLRLSQLMLP